MLTVEKIGGTSMSKFEDVLKNIVIGDRKKSALYNRIFVVSAYNNVTNWLLEHKKTGEAGIYAKFANQEEYTKSLDKLLNKLIKINESYTDIGLNLEDANAFITNRVEQAKNYLKSMADVLATGYVNEQNILLAAREILASLGEAHSAFNSTNILKNNKIKATFVDLCGFNDSEYLTIDERIRKSFKNVNFSKTIAVVTGYTKGSEGIMREFDRGYSEVTFSKIAVEVNADEAIIHKEFHLSSADPKIVGIEKSIPVGFTNYDVADQLADVGMEAIHPKAAKPIEKSGINIRIKNTFEPNHPGTLISKDYIGKESKVEIVTGTDEVHLVEIYDPSMLGDIMFDVKIMEILKKNKISYLLKSINANSISLVIWEHEKNTLIIKELREKYDQVIDMNVAVVCAIGSNIAKPGVLAKAAVALAQNNVNVACVSQSTRQVNIHFVIDREDYKKTIIALNEALVIAE
ncbi:MAG: aspartate kinase [bacterium]|nr:aspartate kinase [bacterium]